MEVPSVLTLIHPYKGGCHNTSEMLMGLRGLIFITKCMRISNSCIEELESLFDELSNMKIFDEIEEITVL